MRASIIMRSRNSLALSCTSCCVSVDKHLHTAITTTTRFMEVAAVHTGAVLCCRTFTFLSIIMMMHKATRSALAEQCKCFCTCAEKMHVKASFDYIATASVLASGSCYVTKYSCRTAWSCITVKCHISAFEYESSKQL
jgi:hypothetical protein